MPMTAREAVEGTRSRVTTSSGWCPAAKRRPGRPVAGKFKRAGAAIALKMPEAPRVVPHKNMISQENLRHGALSNR